MIAIILSLGAVNALIPLLIVLVLIVAAAGSTRGYSIFNFFGLATLAGINPGGKASMVGKSGLSQLMAMIPGFSSGSALHIGQKTRARYASWRKTRYTQKKLFKKNPVATVPQGSRTVPQGSGTASQVSRSVPQAQGRATPFELGPRKGMRFSLWPVYKAGERYNDKEGASDKGIYKKYTPGSYLRYLLKMPQKGAHLSLSDLRHRNEYSLAEKVNRVMGLRVLKYALVAAVPLSLPLYNVVHKRIGMRAEVDKLARQPSVQPLLQQGQKLRAQVERGEKTKRAAFKSFKEEYEKTAGVPQHSPTRFAVEAPLSLASAALYALIKEKDNIEKVKEEVKKKAMDNGDDEATISYKVRTAENEVKAKKWEKLKQDPNVILATTLANVLDVHPISGTGSGRIIPGAFIGSEDLAVRLELHRIKSRQYGDTEDLESLRKRVNESSFKDEKNREKLNAAIDNESRRQNTGAAKD